MIDTIDIAIHKTSKSRIQELDVNNIQFGKLYSDHMFVAEYEGGEWKDLRIEPFQDLSISPANATLHYGQSVFEGLKAYKSKNGDIQIFRPEDNCLLYTSPSPRD